MRPLLLSPLLLAACVTAPAVGAGIKVDPNTRPSCAALCEGMGLRLEAVVLVRNSSGCVCVVPEASPGTTPRAALRAGGIAVASGTLIVEEEQEQALQAQPPTSILDPQVQ
jgi:hypothetical protein